MQCSRARQRWENADSRPGKIGVKLLAKRSSLRRRKLWLKIWKESKRNAF